MNLFTKNPNLNYFVLWRRGGGGSGARVRIFFLLRIQIKKKKSTDFLLNPICIKYYIL